MALNNKNICSDGEGQDDKVSWCLKPNFHILPVSTKHFSAIAQHQFA